MREIPIQPNVASQTFNLTLDDQALNMTARWNSRGQFWGLTIAQSGDDLVTNLCLRKGTLLLRVFNLGLGDLAIVGQEATLANIGTDSKLIWLSEAEVAANG